MIIFFMQHGIPIMSYPVKWLEISAQLKQFVSCIYHCDILRNKSLYDSLSIHLSRLCNFFTMKLLSRDFHTEKLSWCSLTAWFMESNLNLLPRAVKSHFSRLIIDHASGYKKERKVQFQSETSLLKLKIGLKE